MEILEKIGFVKSAADRLRETVSVEEVSALIRHVAEQGIDTAVGDLAALVKALDAYQRDNSLEAHTTMLEKYTVLVKHAKGRHGRILLENSKTYRYIKAPILLTIGLFVLMAVSEILGNWLADVPTPEDGWLWRVMFVQHYILDYLAPFLWGAIGACVYLLKHLYDIARDREFDSTKFHGWYIRVMLGSILGGIVFYLYNIGDTGEDSINIDAKALAFFTGVGVRVVYGAIERTIVLLAEKLNLDAVRRARRQKQTATAFLTEMLDKTDKNTDPDRFTLLTDLLTEAEKRGEG